MKVFGWLVVVAIFGFLAGGVFMTHAFNRDIQTGVVTVDGKVYATTEIRK